MVWSFVEQMLIAFKFPEAFQKLIMFCVTSVSYSLVINGSSFGFFKGERGLRQGDPLSPLLFTLCMEYLSRILKCATEKLPFRFHPLCKEVGLTHLLFADDLLMFCKGDAASILVLLRSFAAFSEASGLKMNASKSNVYFNGVKEGLRQEILSISGFVEGQMPFKYLGVPITAGRLRRKDCNVLIEKVTSRVRAIGAKTISYAGRLVLVQSVFSTLFNYWASIFILPKSVLRRISAICRNFLWDGGVEQRRVPSIAWEKVCKPKKQGGLGLKDEIRWNNAAVGKLVWWLVSKADSLWIKWVDHVYMKGKDVMECESKVDDCWYWKKVLKVRDMLRAGFVSETWSDLNRYTIQRGYVWLSPDGDTASWYKRLWCSRGIPKHVFLTWMIHHDGLRLKAKMYSYGVVADPYCCICGCQLEDRTHLFQLCVYVIRVWSMLADWLGIVYKEGDNLWELRMSRRWPKLKRRLVTLTVMAAYYSVWEQRNKAWIDCLVESPSFVVRRIVSSLKYHVNVEKSKEWSYVDKEWWNRLM